VAHGDANNISYPTVQAISERNTVIEAHSRMQSNPTDRTSNMPGQV